MPVWNSRNWSFRWNVNDFELVRDSTTAVAPVYHLNLRHFRRHRPGVDHLITKYDDALTELRGACQDAYAWLVAQPELRAIAARITDRDVAPYVAEYAINSAQELPEQQSRGPSTDDDDLGARARRH